MWLLFRIFAVLLVFTGILSLLPARNAAKTTAAPTATVTAPAVPAPATEAPRTGAAAMVLTAQNGAVLAEKNADERRPMASTTKIMTALVVLERLPLDTVVTVPPEAVGVEGSSIYLFAGEQITAETLLWGLLLSSANDAAAALAVAAAGSVPAFVALMNEKAAALGLSDTHFENPHGLHAEGHFTTARDLARLALAALENETFAEMVAAKRHTAPQNGTGAARLFVNHNRLLSTYEGAVGVKTGYTRAAGRCLVSAAKRNGLLLVAVTLSDGSDWADHKALFDWGFSNYAFFRAELPVKALPVTGGSAGEAAVALGAAFSCLLPAAHGEITCTAELPHFLYGGCRAGDVLGRAVFYAGDEVLCTLPVIAAETVEPLRRSTLFERIRRVWIK